jgi:hypothetical protein
MANETKSNTLTRLLSSVGVEASSVLQQIRRIFTIKLECLFPASTDYPQPKLKKNI